MRALEPVSGRGWLPGDAQPWGGAGDRRDRYRSWRAWVWNCP